MGRSNHSLDTQPGFNHLGDCQNPKKSTLKVGVGVARKYFNFDLPYGPYNCDVAAKKISQYPKINEYFQTLHGLGDT